MPRRLVPVAAALLAVATAPAAQTHAERVARIERALVPRVVVENEEAGPVSIAERMAELGVPGVSVAFFEGGEVVWTRAYGLADVEGGVPVTPETRFQAASISKPVAATVALDLVEDGRLALDADVNAALATWQVPASAFAEDQPVTLRGLLTHTAGLSGHGFPGYGPGETVPGTAGVLWGDGNTDAVVVDQRPRTAYRYSGGGYTVMQLAVEDATGQPFADVAAARVLGPLGMTRSTFAQPLPEALRDEAATGYRRDSAAVAGRFHTYPEVAAAGLWTTPTDLARWAIALQRSLAGEPHPVLDAETVRQMVTPDSVGGHGLGPGLPFDAAFFGHGGANEGFRCLLRAQLGGDQGVVVMTNADTGSALMEDVVRTVAREYGWGHHESIRKTVVSLSADRLGELAGRYRGVERPGWEIEMRPEAGGLVGRLGWNGNEVRLAPESETDFFDRADGTAIVFDGPAGFTVQGLHFERVEAE